MLISIDSYIELDELKEAVMQDNRTVCSGDTFYMQDNYSIELRLSNGETLAARQGNIQYEIFSFGTLFQPEEERFTPNISLMLMNSDHKDLSALSNIRRHAYIITQLKHYDIESITLNGTTFKQGDVRTANTLKAMFAEAEKQTGEFEKYHLLK